MNLIQELNESSLFRAKNLGAYDLRSLCDLAYIFCVSLIIIRQLDQSEDYAINYAKQTAKFNNFEHKNQSNTDLYQILNVFENPHLIDKLDNEAENEKLFKKVDFDQNTMLSFLRALSNRNFNKNTVSRLIIKIENDLNMKDATFKSYRRVAINFDSLSLDDKKLIISKLKMKMNLVARKSDIYQVLNDLTFDKEGFKLKFIGSLLGSIGAGIALGKILTSEFKGKK